MKRILTAVILALMTLISCDIEMLGGDESSVNQFIYPYLEFTLLDDGTCSVSVLEGAATRTLRIPSSLDGVKVSEFTGFQNPADAERLERLTIDISTSIVDGALDKAINLREIIFEGITAGSVWPELPAPEASDGKHFAGWFAGEEEIHAGMPVDPENTVARPVYGTHTLTFVEGQNPTCTEPGKRAHYICSGCGALFSDSEGLDEIHEEDIVISPLEHDETGTWITSADQHWKICSRCDAEIMRGNHVFSDYEHTQDNVWTRTCTVCGYSESSEHVEHTLSHHESVEATCTENGSIEYWECSFCGKYFSDENATAELDESEIIVPVLGHLSPDNPTADDYNHNDNEHWLLCNRCNEELAGTRGKHVYDVTFEFDADDRTLTATSSACICGYKPDSGTTGSQTGAFDISVGAGATAERQGNDNVWLISINPEEVLDVVTCIWTENGKNEPLVTGTAPFSFTWNATTQDDSFTLVGHLYDGSGHHIRDVLVYMMSK